MVNISKCFGEIAVLCGFSMSVEQGKAVSVAGPSGCGKTTLLRLIAGLEKPDGGEVRLFDSTATGNGVFLPPSQRNLGMVFQELALWPHMRVERHLGFVLKTMKLSRGEREQRISQLLNLCKLADRRREFPNNLSTGEKQRLAIMRALATRPRILLLDEPFSNLDDKLRNEIREEIVRLQNQLGITILIATHDAGDTEGWVDDRVEVPG